MWMDKICIEDGTYSVFACIVRCGQDISVTVGGGESPHIGASALAVPRPSLNDPEMCSASTSVFCITGHKEDEFARRAAQTLASRLNCAVNVTAGVHIDHAKPEELARLGKNLEALLCAVLEKLI